MKLTTNDLNTLAECAIDAARKAGAFIAQTRPIQIQRKADADSLASQVVTEVDQQSQDLIIAALKPTLSAYDLALLTEESEDDRERLEKDYFWCIDPIDGTLPFIEGVPGYAVSIALVSREGDARIGVAFDPAGKNLYHAVAGQGAFRNLTPWTILPQEKQPQIFTDRSVAQQPYFNDIVEALNVGKIETQGGAVMNAMWCLEHAPAAYFKFPTERGGGSLWDFAVAACIFRELGAVASDIYGEPLDLNRADSTIMNHRGILFATDSKLAAEIKAFYSSYNTAV